jgi:penicillin-binding protein A
VLLALFGVLFVNLNVITLMRSDDLANHPANRRLIVREYEIARGPIVVGEQAIAVSTPPTGSCATCGHTRKHRAVRPPHRLLLDRAAALGLETRSTST